MKDIKFRAYCKNYKHLSAIEKAITDYNNKEGYEKLHPYRDTSNCEHCDKYPRLGFMKVCFKLPLIYRVERFIWGLKEYRIRLELYRKGKQRK